MLLVLALVHMQAWEVGLLEELVVAVEVHPHQLENMAFLIPILVNLF
jgi:hypothetical protein